VLHRYILHNDGIRGAADPLLSAGQVGLLSGWGVFTTMRVVDGIPFAFERHWARLTRDAQILNIDLPFGAETIRHKLLELIEANRADRATLRLVIVRNRGGFWAAPDQGRASDLIALTADSKSWGASVKLCYVPHGRHAASPFAGTKVLSWAMNLRCLESAQERGFDEVILLNERGEVAESTSANIFVANGSQVWTPPLASGCLAGITREVLLDEIHAPGISIGEKTLFPSDLESADEVFITSTTRNLVAVGQIGERRVGRSDQVRTVLDDTFGEYLRRYVSRQREALATRA